MNAQNYNGMTPLHQAVTYNSTDAMKVLLQHGADPSIVDNTGKTVFDLALNLNEREAIRLLEQY